MKKFRYIIPVILVAASSCTSQLFTGTAYDDLYYRESDQPVVAAQQNSPDRTKEQYYDNIFAGDTLIADEYVPYDEYLSQEAILKDGSADNNYYNYLSPSDQIYLFNDSYFYPYWRDPFYFSPFSTRLSFGYNYFGSPYFGGGMYDPFWYDSYMYSPYMYNSYNSYNPYWGYNSYWGYGYNPWMYSGYYNNGYYYQSNDVNSNYIARRGGFSTSVRPATTGDGRNKAGSSYTQGNVSSGSQGTVPSRRSTYGTTDGTNTTTRSGSGVSRTSTDGTRTFSAPNTVTQNPGYNRRESTGISTQVRSQGQVPVQGETRTQSVNRPQYQTTERTYTPSYNNPRMSSRPSYNNSRSTTEGSGTSVYNNQGAVRSSSGTSGQTRTQYNNSSSGYTPSRSSSSPVYSAPSRSSGSTSVSSGSRSSSGSSSYSGGSSSYSSGSRSSSSGSSSSGSSSGSSSSSSSTSSSSSEGSGGRRR